MFRIRKMRLNRILKFLVFDVISQVERAREAIVNKFLNKRLFFDEANNANFVTERRQSCYLLDSTLTLNNKPKAE